MIKRTMTGIVITAVVYFVIALVVPKATPGYAGGQKIASSEE